MPPLPKNDLRRAVDNIANWGDTDIFPLPVENHVFHDVPEKVTDLLSAVASNFDAEVTKFPVDRATRHSLLLGIQDSDGQPRSNRYGTHISSAL
jgi:hypothetical protein